MAALTARTGRRRGAGKSPAGAIVTVPVTQIGNHGDGIAIGPTGRLYIPRTLPGEQVRARILARRGDGHAAELIEVLSPAEGRALPPCRHFERCGGCSLQHLGDADYAGFKLARLSTALARAGAKDAVIAPLVRTPPGGRRRASLAAIGKSGRSCTLGFFEKRDHAVVDLAECPVLDGRITGLLPALRGLLAGALTAGQRAGIAVAVLDGGLDVVLELAAAPGLALRERCAAFAAEIDVARLSWRPAAREPAADQPAEPIVQRRPVGPSFAGNFVAVPAGAFLQASAAGEAALVAAVGAAIGGARAVVDLFAGVGTFAVPLAARGLRVLAVDADGAALAAAARAAPGIATQTRDLFARPLTAAELQGFDAAVFDPPRAGSAAQAGQLAASAVPVVVAVSCNPETFARDARLLVAGGYRLERVVPVDQFLWSAHLELAAVFRRDGPPG